QSILGAVLERRGRARRTDHRAHGALERLAGHQPCRRSLRGLELTAQPAGRCRSGVQVTRARYRATRRRKRAGMGGYRGLLRASIDNPEAFWAEAARAVSWTREPRRVLDDSNPPFFRWFPDGELNTCANALDRHVADGRCDQPALIYDSPVTGTQRTYSYAEL